MSVNNIKTKDFSFNALVYGYLMVLAYFGGFIWNSPAMLFISNSIAFIAGYGMFRCTWNANARLVPILWLMAFSLFHIFSSWALGYANFGPEMTERKIRGLQIVFIEQCFGVFGGGILLTLSIALCFRGFFPNKP